MSDTWQRIRDNTRQKIQDVALELFAEHGYEKTSLRQIAQRLGVTKAALYYHFRTKEDILVSIFDDMAEPIDELIEWGGRQPRALENKQEVIRRYSGILATAAPLIRFIHANLATVRELAIGEMYVARMTALHAVITDPGASLSDQVRCFSALFMLNASISDLGDAAGNPIERQEAVLAVALDLVSRAHTGAGEPSA